MKDLEQLLRPNILRLTPYSSARNEYKGHEAKIFLDANENPYNSPYNRYPDPLQTKLKAAVSKVKGVPATNIFIGNGSDEAIDLVYRCFAEPGKDNAVAIEPTYGMYKVCADVNDVEYRAVPLRARFSLDAADLLAACDDNTKIVWLCSPNNPTGNSLDPDEMETIIDTFSGITVVDEAYIDFAKQGSCRRLLNNHPRLIVLSTMSKAWGAAAIRLGMAFASTDIVEVFNKVKYPYNVNALTQEKALELLANPYNVDHNIRMILMERDRMIPAFRLLPICNDVYPTDANFFLARMTDADTIYNYLLKQGIVVRNRSRVALCGNCLRVTVGMRGENNALLGALRSYGQH